jgi:hypothetical protein
MITARAGIPTMVTLARRYHTVECHPRLYPNPAAPVSNSRTKTVMPHRYGYRPARNRSISPNIAMITSQKKWGIEEKLDSIAGAQARFLKIPAGGQSA